MTASTETFAYLALGSNLGDRAATMRSAIDSLNRTQGIDVVRTSTIIETAPEGLPGQGPYLNAAVMVRTSLPPSALLLTCLAIERAHGRERNDRERWGPRLLDIDVLLYGDQVIDDLGPPRILVPHPHMTQRLFVLKPLAEIAAQTVHPNTGLTVQVLLNRLLHSAGAEYCERSPCFHA